MRFEFIPRESLPRLAWCAHLHRGDDVVIVQHGPWVETMGSWFVEGTWTGPFGAGAVVETDHLVGTAGRAERDRVLFCSPHNLCDRVHSLRTDDDLYVSNSLPFLLQITGDGPDPRYIDYAFDRLRQQAMGLRQTHKALPTARGREMLLHDFCVIAVRSDLSIQRIEKPVSRPPVNFADCVAQIDALLAAILANAADADRQRRRFRPIATVSRGYDAGALAALMRRHGAREALTFRVPPEDDGTEVAERLGYTVTGYDRLGFTRLPGAPEAEFYATPWGYDVPTAACENQLAGALLVTGRRGGRLFETATPGLPDLFYPRLGALAGASMAEFRLRVGFFQVIPYYTLALHQDAVFRITISPEMKPWSIGGTYDRPIPRRILEEAGVPRDWFGWKKHATAKFLSSRLDEMSAGGAADFAAFLRTMPKLSWWRRSTQHSLVLLHELALRANRVRRRAYRMAGRSTPSMARGQDLRILARRPPYPMMFAFHWGCARVQERYTINASGSARHTA